MRQTHRDGKLSFEEIKSYNQNFINEKFNDEGKNHDGFVDWNEAKQTPAIKFDEAYWNHDGKLSFEEIKSYNHNFFKELFNDGDKNHDGFIDLNEEKQASAKDFVEADWNHDGKLSFEGVKGALRYREIDWNQDGKLSFEGVKGALRYREIRLES